MHRNENKRKFISLKKQLSVLFAGLYMSIFLITAALWGISVFNYQKEKTTAITEGLNGYVEELENDIKQTNTIVLRMYLENKSFSTLSLETSEIEKYNRIYDLMDNIELQVNLDRSIDGLFIYYNNNKNVIYKMSDRLDVANKEMVLRNNVSMLSNLIKDSGSFVQHTGDYDYFTIYYVKNGTAVVGLINLGKGLDEIGEGQAWKAKGIVENNNVFPNQKSQMSAEPVDYAQLMEGRSRIGKRIVYLKSVGGTQMKVFYEEEISIWQYAKVQQLLILAALLFSVYPALKIYWLLKKQILQPLADMTKTMQVVQTGQWDAEFHIDTNLEEIENVKKALAVMTKEITHWKIQSYEEKLNKQHAQLQYLQLQLNPHFYINCLKLIQAKLQLGCDQEVENFLIQLSSHFRYLMKKATEFVRVEEEMTFVHNYLELTKELFPGKVNSYILVDEEAKQKEIPMLAVQTFVENSIKYARKDMEQELQLTIKIQYLNVEEGEFLNLIIKDNGTGYPELFLNALNNADGEKEMAGNGIANLKKRIMLLYDKDYNWYFYNQQGALSELLLPCKLEKERKADGVNDEIIDS